MGEPQRINGEFSMRVKASLNVNPKRVERNNKEANVYASEGYLVERNLHPNGAFFAVIGNHHAHEIEVGRIMAENGLSFTLDREGTTIKLPNGKRYKIPTPDGHIEGHTHEIYAFRGNPDPRTVVEAIRHSRKAFRPDSRRNIQSEVAISLAPKGSGYKASHISSGVSEYKRQVRTGEATAKPRIYLHVDETTRSVYYWSLK